MSSRRSIFALLGFLLAGAIGLAAEIRAVERLAALRTMTEGRIAFCQPTVLDELQVIGKIRKLTTDEARKLCALFAAEETYYEKQPDGTLKGMVPMCMPHWDFKVVLLAKEGNGSAAIRICSSCSQISLVVDGEFLSVPSIRSEAFAKLASLFDEWFPNWRAITSDNKKKWDDDRRNGRL